MLEQVSLLELSPAVLTRALQPFAIPVRTLEALHLASLDYLRANGQVVWLASYHERLNDAAGRLGVKLYAFGR